MHTWAHTYVHLLGCAVHCQCMHALCMTCVLVVMRHGEGCIRCAYTPHHSPSPSPSPSPYAFSHHHWPTLPLLPGLQHSRCRLPGRSGRKTQRHHDHLHPGCAARQVIPAAAGHCSLYLAQPSQWLHVYMCDRCCTNRVCTYSRWADHRGQGWRSVNW